MKFAKGHIEVIFGIGLQWHHPIGSGPQQESDLIQISGGGPFEHGHPVIEAVEEHDPVLDEKR